MSARGLEAPHKEDAAPRTVRLRPGVLAAILVFGTAGWGWGAYERFVALPGSAAHQRIATTLELVDRFSDGDPQRAYVKLSEDLKPWWEMIETQQRKIMGEQDDAAREKLIASRDEMLVGFIRDHNLGPDIDLLVDGFDPFDRCLSADACDEDTLRKSISIDVKRIYRTFKPYIQVKRDAGKPDDKDFGKGLEGLFFRFLG